MSNLNQQTNFIRTSSHACARRLTNRSSHHNMTLPSRHFDFTVHDKVLWYNAPWPREVFLQSERKLCYSEGCSCNLLPLIYYQLPREHQASTLSWKTVRLSHLYFIQSQRDQAMWVLKLQTQGYTRQRSRQLQTYTITLPMSGWV